jgi:uncharacterized membrane protein
VNRRWSANLQYAAVALCLIGYAVLCHYSNSLKAPSQLGAGLALAPLVAIVLVGAWRLSPPVFATALSIGLCVGIYRGWPLLKDHYTWIYLLQECGLYGVLGATFARSLRAGATPVCTLLAERVHGALTAAEIRYTRQVTAAWALFFAAIVLTELLLFFDRPLIEWSFFSNFCVLPLVLLMFCTEYAIRRRVLPQETPAGLLATMRTYFVRSA